MAAYTDSHGFNKGSAAGHPAKGLTRVGYMEVDLDFAKITTARAAAGATAGGGGAAATAASAAARDSVNASANAGAGVCWCWSALVILSKCFRFQLTH